MDTVTGQCLLDDPAILAENDLLANNDEGSDDIFLMPKAPEKTWSQWVAISALIASIVSFGLSFGYTICHDRSTARSTESRFVGIETSLRVLTETVAPQMYKSINDSLHAALSSSGYATDRQLKTVKASIGQLKAAHVRSSPADLQQGGQALATLTAEHPKSGEGWATSGAFISYVSDSLNNFPTANDAMCVKRPFTITSQSTEPPPPGVQLIFAALFHDCTLVLDDATSFERSDAYFSFLQMHVKNHTSTLALTLDHVRVIYRGGALVPAGTIRFHNCIFDFQLPPSVPPDSGQKLVRGLLEADLTQPFTVNVSSGM